MSDDVYDDDFGFRARLERDFAIVKDEWQRFDKRHLRLWPEAHAFHGQWAVFPLVLAEKRLSEACALFPKTAALLDTVPGLHTSGFSCLGPRSWLPSHRGEGDDLLRAHLAIEIHEPSGIEVSGKTYHWREGATFCFDDTALHRSWNDNDHGKVVLIIDFKRPAHLVPPHADVAKLEGQRRHFADHYHAIFGDWIEST